MTALDGLPKNPNQLSNINFKLLIKRMPGVVFFCHKANIPGANLPVTWQPTPFVDIPEYGDHLEFKPFVVSFKVDEDLRNYVEFYSWLREIGKADSFAEFKKLKSQPNYTGRGIKSEAILSILDSNRNANFNITYHDCIPVDISDLNFDAQSPDVMMINATATMRYINWTFERSTNEVIS